MKFDDDSIPITPVGGQYSLQESEPSNGEEGDDEFPGTDEVEEDEDELGDETSEDEEDEDSSNDEDE